LEALILAIAFYLASATLVNRRGIGDDLPLLPSFSLPTELCSHSCGEQEGVLAQRKENQQHQQHHPHYPRYPLQPAEQLRLLLVARAHLAGSDWR